MAEGKIICRVANMGKCSVPEKDCRHSTKHEHTKGCDSMGCGQTLQSLCVPTDEFEMKL